MSEKKKSNGLPSHADWNLDADDKFLRRFKRLVRAVPWFALERMSAYLDAVIDEARCAPTVPYAPTGKESNGRAGEVRVQVANDETF